MDGSTGGAPWWVAGSLVAGALAMKAFDWILARRKERTETDANVVLLEQLREGLRAQGDRIKSMEDEMGGLRARLDEEIKLRMAAEEAAHKLRLRVISLESALRQLGAVIPPDPTEQG